MEKKVQKYVKTRSSTQARSHAQKFFFKIKRSNVLDIDIDLNKNSIKTLYEFANKLDEEKYESTIKTLNVIAFEKNSNLGKERMSLDYTITTNEENFSRNESTSLFGRSESYNNEEIIFSADDINMDTTSQLTSNSSSFKKTHKKDHQKLFIEDEKEAKQAPENEKVESKLNEIKQKRRRRKSSSFIRIYPDCEITVFDLYNSCDDEEIHNDEPLVSFQNCFNFFFNQKVNCDVFDEEEFEKYYLLKEAKDSININTDKKNNFKLFSSEISNNPNLKKRKKLFQISPVLTSNKSKPCHDFLKQKRIKFATLHTPEIILKESENVKKSL